MSGTHGTNITAGPSADATPPEATSSTGEPPTTAPDLETVIRTARQLIPAEGIITDHSRLRTYECDGLAHYKVVPALVVVLPKSTAPLGIDATFGIESVPALIVVVPVAVEAVPWM